MFIDNEKPKLFLFCMILFSQTSVVLHSPRILLLRQIAEEYFRDTCRFSSGDSPTVLKGKAAIGNEISWKRNLGVSAKLFRNAVGVTQNPSKLIFQSGSRVLTRRWVFLTPRNHCKLAGMAVWLSPMEALASLWEQMASFPTGGHSSRFWYILFFPLVSSIWLCSKAGLIFLFSRYQICLNSAHSLLCVSWKQQILSKTVMLG